MAYLLVDKLRGHPQMYVKLLDFPLRTLLGLEHFQIHVLANLEFLLSALTSFLPELILRIS